MYMTKPARKRGPSSPRRTRSPRQSSVDTFEEDLTSMPTTASSPGRSTTKSTSSPRLFRQYPILLGPSIHESIFRISPTTKVSSKFPYCDRKSGSLLRIFSELSRSRRPPTPESTTYTFGRGIGPRSVRRQAGRRWITNISSNKRV